MKPCPSGEDSECTSLGVNYNCLFTPQCLEEKDIYAKLTTLPTPRSTKFTPNIDETDEPMISRIVQMTITVKTAVSVCHTLDQNLGISVVATLHSLVLSLRVTPADFVNTNQVISVQARVSMGHLK